MIERSKKLTRSKNFYFTVLNKLKEGYYPAKICKDLNISKQNLNYYLRKLKDLGYIEKLGYGVWEVKKSTKDGMLTIPKSVRGHAFIWSVKIPNKIKKWNKRKEILTKGNIFYKEVGIKKTPRIFINNRKIWLGNKTITIYEPKSFYGAKAIDSKKYAVISLIETLKALEKKLQINLKPYTFKCSREHYGLIKNDLAKQCNRTGEKIYIRDDLDGLWLWIDNSFNLNELENSKEIRNMQVQTWFNDHKKHDFKVTPTFIMESINKVTNNQLIFAENMKSHINAIQELAKGVKELREEIKKKNERED